MNAPKPQRSPSDETDRLREALARDLEDPIHGRDSRSIALETAEGLIIGPLAPLLAALTAERTAREEAEARAPKGWMLVPIVPTTEMRRAMARACTLGWDIGDHTWEMGLKYAPKLTAARALTSTKGADDV